MTRSGTVEWPLHGFLPRRTGSVLLGTGGAIVVAVVSFLSVSYSEVAGIAALALAAAVIIPDIVLPVTLAWLLLMRPGYEFVHATIAGVAVTEIDVLPLLATVSVLALRGKASERPARRRFGTVLLTLGYPLWLLVRFLLIPTSSAIQIPPVVDYRNITMFSVVVPLVLYINKRGFEALFKLLMWVAYTSCAIAVAAWILLMLGVVSPANTAFVYFHAANDVRPGGELLVLVLAVMLLTGRAPLVARSRVLSFALLFAEFLVSQTLSMVVALVAGVVFNAMLRRGGGMFRRLSVAVVVIGLFAGLAAGGLAAGSRFDLGERLGESSAQYRVTEFAQLRDAVTTSPSTLMLGAGPGSALAVPNVYTGLVDVKRDTHNTYGNVALKGGLVALALFIAPLLVVIVRLTRSREPTRLSLASAVVAVAVLTVTVPFAWTAPGLTGLIAIVLGSLHGPSRPKQQSDAAEQPPIHESLGRSSGLDHDGGAARLRPRTGPTSGALRAASAERSRRNTG